MDVARDAELTVSHAIALAHLGETNSALERLRTVVEGAQDATLHHVQAIVHILAEQPAPAIASLNRGLALSGCATDAVLQFTKAHALLQLGRWKEAWPLWEARLRHPEHTFARRHNPQWTATPLIRGNRILLVSEQGIGDTVLFSRFASNLAEHKAVVTLLCQPEVRRLLETVPGVTRAIAGDEVSLEDYDTCLPLLSLPGFLGITPENLPGRPYISASLNGTNRWHALFSRYGRRLKVGLAWQGNPRYADDWRRSVSLDTMARLSSVDGVQLFSLQKGEGAQQLLRACNGPPIIDLADGLADFADTAEAMQHLDVVISVDTAVAHVAGALGRHVWVMLSYSPAPLWMLGRSDTPLYPNARLFRQARPGDWASVLDTMVTELRRLRDTALTGAERVAGG